MKKIFTPPPGKTAEALRAVKTLPPPGPTMSGLEGRVAELEEALGREMRVGSALRDVGSAQGTTLNIDQLLELIVGKITEALDADRATLYLIDPKTEELVARVIHGEEVRAIRLEPGQGIAGYCARTGRSLLVENAYEDPRFDRTWDEQSGYLTRSIVATPLYGHGGRLMGVVQALNKRRGAFSRSDLELLEVLAAQAGVTIDHSRLVEELREKNSQLSRTKAELELRVRDLKMIVNLQTAIAHAQSMEELLVAVLGEAMRTCDARAAAVALRDPDSGTISLHVVDDRHKRLRRFAIREGQGLVGHAMQSKQVVLTEAADDDARADATLNELVGIPCVSALAVPLEGEDGDAMGAIALYNKQYVPTHRPEGATDRHPRTMPPPQGNPAFSRDDLALVALIAQNASTSIRLELSRESREREERLSTIGRLLSGVIHDLKTPLAVVRGFVGRMEQEDKAPKRHEYSGIVLKQLDHMTALQRDVLEFARGERNVLMRKVYLQAFFEQIRQEIEAQLVANDIELVIDLQDRGTARFDEARITRVIHNLARNALDAMADGGGKFTIKVSREKDNALLLTFVDTGPGIPKEIEHRLFQSFVTSGKKGGTGLGLAIVKKITDEHHGSISVHSTSRGATFKIRLPQASET